MNSWQSFFFLFVAIQYNDHFLCCLEEFFSFIQSHLSVLSLYLLSYWSSIQEVLVYVVTVFSLFFHWRSFRVLGLTLIHFESILVQWEGQESSFSLLHVDIQLSQQHLLKRLVFLQYMFWASLSKIR
jgi:hypothetical protein